MFRGLTGAIERKKKGLIKGGEGEDKLNRAFTRFLDEYFPEGKGLGFEVSVLNNRVTIQAPNKTVANELIFRTRDLAKVFKEGEVGSDQIVIR